ncbi:MAG: hypothetical protein PHV05_07955 [Candidatus Riflebacteria bacterium]|nr:hypothetical protein [Candidatus Riflebacteria bacterium]
MNETELKKLCVEMIRKEFPQIRITRMQCGTVVAKGGRRIKMADAGWPDYIGYTNTGKSVAIEAKAPGARPRKDQPEQDARLADMAACGCLVLRVNSIDECREQLKKILDAD